MVEETTDKTQGSEEEQKDGAVQHPPLAGLVRDQTPTFWKILLSFLTARYIFKVANAIFFRDNPKQTPGAKFMRSSFYPYAAGGMFLAITGKYGADTLKDIKKLSAETISYETGKPADQVGYLDLFKSQNRFVKETVMHYRNRMAARVSSMMTFFIPWHKLPGPGGKPLGDKVNSELAVDAGVGVLGVYLGMDTGRRATSYERWVGTVGKKIIKSDLLDSKPYDIIDSNDVAMFLIDHYHSHSKGYTKPPVNSPAGQQLETVSQRIADLLNMTYGNTKTTEPAHFTDGKLFFMVDMLDKPYSLGFVELANKSKDMSEVKAVASAIEKGTDPKTAFAQYGITVGSTATGRQIPAASPEPVTAKFADTVSPAKDRIPQTARTPQEFAEQGQQTTPSL